MLLAVDVAATQGPTLSAGQLQVGNFALLISPTLDRKGPLRSIATATPHKIGGAAGGGEKRTSQHGQVWEK